MKSLANRALSLFLACLATALPLAVASAADETNIVFQNGRSVPITAVTVQGDQIVLTDDAEGFRAGQKFPLSSADHIYGTKPVDINRAVALILTGEPKNALGLLEPVVTSQRISAKIPGNFWLEAARAALVAYALAGDSANATSIGKEISDATPQQGIDPFVSLGKALMLPGSTPPAERETAFRDLTTDNLPAPVCAYASFFLGNALVDSKKKAEALEAYLWVPCLFPSGGMVLNAAAELKAAEFLTDPSRREEAVALIGSAVIQSRGTVLGVEANKRLESLK